MVVGERHLGQSDGNFFIDIDFPRTIHIFQKR